MKYFEDKKETIVNALIFPIYAHFVANLILYNKLYGKLLKNLKNQLKITFKQEERRKSINEFHLAN